MNKIVAVALFVASLLISAPAQAETWTITRCHGPEKTLQHRVLDNGVEQIRYRTKTTHCGKIIRVRVIFGSWTTVYVPEPLYPLSD